MQCYCSKIKATSFKEQNVTLNCSVKEIRYRAFVVASAVRLKKYQIYLSYFFGFFRNSKEMQPGACRLSFIF